MKRKMMIVLAAVLLMAGCGNVSDNTAKDRVLPSTPGVKEVLEQKIAETTEGEKANTEGMIESKADMIPSGNTSRSEKEVSADTETEEVEVDLTVLSSTMVYSEVYNMMVQPDQYIGKTVKMQGAYYAYHDTNTDQYYFSCIIQDATACCSQGLEFVLNENYIFPNDYPTTGEEITVVGIFDTYMEGEYRYCTLRDARIL